MKVIEVFVKMREVITDTLRIHLDIEIIKKKIENQDNSFQIKMHLFGLNYQRFKISW